MLEDFSVRGNNGWVGAAGKYDNSTPGGVLLRQLRDFERHLFNIGGFYAELLAEFRGFVVVAKEEVGFGHDVDFRVGEVGNEKWGAEIHDENLPVVAGVVGDLLDHLGGCGEHKTTDVLRLGRLHQLPVVSQFEVVN